MAYLVLIRFLNDQQDVTCISCADAKTDIFHTVYALSKSPNVLQIAVTNCHGEALMPKDYGFGNLEKWVKDITYGVLEDADACNH